MIYARAHDHKVAEDYYAAMGQVEKQLDLNALGDVKVPIKGSERAQLLSLTEQLTVSGLSKQERLEVVAQMRFLLTQESGLHPEGMLE